MNFTKQQLSAITKARQVANEYAPKLFELSGNDFKKAVEILEAQKLVRDLIWGGFSHKHILNQFNDNKNTYPIVQQILN